MNWLISLLAAGAMLFSEGDLPARADYNRAESNIKTVVFERDETERFEQTYALNANGRVGVSNVNGSVTIETWDRSEVKLEYVKTADNREHLADVEIKIDARADSFQVETDYGSRKRGRDRESKNNGKLQVEYHLTVPHGAVLDEIETVNGSINIANAANTTKASSVNGEVRATNLRGAASLSTVNGTVEADFDQLANGGKISLATVNGQVNLIIPSDANATVKADTLNGSIANDFGLPVRKGEYVGRDLYGRIGSGAVQIRLNSVNGGLAIRRRNDGKNLNPATNLLSQKSKTGEEDFDNDFDDEDGDTQQNNKNVPPAPPAAPPPPLGKLKIKEKEMAQAMKEAEKEVARLQPELDKISAEALKEANAAVNSPEFQAKIKEAEKLALEQISEGNWFGGAPRVESKNESFAVKGTPTVKIGAKNCAVAVRGWDKPEVRYTATKISRGRNRKPLEIKGSHTNSEVNIEVSGAPDDGFFGSENRLRLEVFVPRKSNLKVTTGGEIRLEGVSGEIDLQGADATINVRDADGKLSVGTTEGQIRVIGFRGVFDGKTVVGTMNLEGDFQSFNAQTADGSIILNVPENTNAFFETSADIENEGLNLTREGTEQARRWRIGRGGTIYRIDAGEGRIFLRAANFIKTN